MLTDKERGTRTREKFEEMREKDNMQEQVNEMRENVEELQRSNAILQKENRESKSSAVQRRGGNPSEHPFRIYPIRKKKAGFSKNK